MALLSLFKPDLLPFDLSTLLLFLTCYTITFLFWLNFKSKSDKSTLNLPPSPPKLPIIGNLHQLGTLPHRSLHTLSKKYGPVMFLHLGQTPTMVVSSAELASEVMKTNDLHFADRPQVTCPTILLYGCNDLGFGRYDESWKEKKKICVNELLSIRRVLSFRNVRAEISGDMANKIRDMCSGGKDYVNLSELVTNTSHDVLCRCVLGDEFNTKGNTTIGELAEKLMINLVSFSVGDYFPSFGWVDYATGLVSRLKAIFVELDDFYDSVIEERRSTMMKNVDQYSKRKSLLDNVLQKEKLQHDDMLHNDFSQNDLKAILVDMFVGGSDTTSGTTEWAMAELMANPSKMEKAQEEIRRVVGNKSKVEDEDIDQMNYLKCVVKETLRLHPPVPLLAPREARSNVNLGGYNIPAKTLVYTNVWSIQRDPEFWETPEEFVPERFEKKDVDYRGKNFHYIPSGSGRRGCPGIMFGVANVESMLANLLYWFDWKLPTINGVAVQHIDMVEEFGISVRKKVPLYLQPIPQYS